MLKLKDLCTGLPVFENLKNDIWSPFLDKNVVSMPKDIKFGSWEVRVKACHTSVAKLKIKELCAGLPVFEIFEKQHVESLPRQKRCFYAREHQIWFMGSQSESVS